jgi:Fe-S oxidoreductase
MERDEDGNVTAMYCSTSCKSGVPHHKLSKQHRKRLEDSAPLGGIPYQATDNSGQKKKPSFEWYSQSSPVSRVPVPVPQHASQTESDDSNMPDLVEKEDERNESSEEEKPKKKQKKKKHPSPPPRRKKIKASDIVISSHHDVSVF